MEEVEGLSPSISTNLASFFDYLLAMTIMVKLSLVEPREALQINKQF